MSKVAQKKLTKINRAVSRKRLHGMLFHDIHVMFTLFTSTKGKTELLKERKLFFKIGKGGDIYAKYNNANTSQCITSISAKIVGSNP